MAIEDGLKLSLKALKRILGENFNVDRIDAAYIKTVEKKFTRIPKAKIEKVSSEIKDDKKPVKK